MSEITASNAKPGKAGSMGNSPSSGRRDKMNNPTVTGNGGVPASVVTAAQTQKTPITKNPKSNYRWSRNDNDIDSSDDDSVLEISFKSRKAEGDKVNVLVDSEPKGTVLTVKDSTSKLVSDDSHEAGSDKENAATLEDKDDNSTGEKNAGARTDKDNASVTSEFISARESDVSGNDSGVDETPDDAVIVDKVPPRVNNANEASRNNSHVEEQDVAVPMDVDTEEEAIKALSKTTGDGSVALGSAASVKDTDALAVEGDNRDGGTRKHNGIISNTSEHDKRSLQGDRKPKAREAVEVPPANAAEGLEQNQLTNPSREHRYRIKASKRTGGTSTGGTGTGGTSAKDAIYLSDSSDETEEKEDRSKADQGTKEASFSGVKEEKESPRQGKANQEESSPSESGRISEPQVDRESQKQVSSEDGNSNGKEGASEANRKPKKKRDLVVGEKVYAEFPANQDYYWGIVQSIHESKQKRPYYKYTYTILFDDGDVGKYIHRKKIFTPDDKDLQELLEVEAEEERANNNHWEAAAQAEGSGAVKPKTLEFDVLSRQEILDLACGKCERCKRKDCGECGACNRFGKEKMCCFHKLCMDIPYHQKLQTTKHLPSNVAFCFLDPDPNSSYDGLAIYTKGGRSYRSIEAFCKWGNKGVDKWKVYGYLGLQSSLQADARTEAEEVDSVETQNDEENDVPPYTPRQLLQKRCGQCSNCLKPSCGKCVCCKGNASRPGDAKNCCYQKMCLEIPVSRKAQPAKNGFPSDWKFYFERPRTGFENLQGLVIIPPSKQHPYASAESAVKHCYKKLADVDVDLFYKFVGLAGQEPATVRKRCSEAEEGSLGRAKRTRMETFQGRTGLSPRELYERRCGNCLMCVKPSCDKCLSCRDNKNHTRAFREVCFHKMCCEIDPADKAQPAWGLPAGWKFFYMHPREISWAESSQHTGLAGFVLQSPVGELYSTVEDADTEISSIVGDVKFPEVTRKFYKHIGCHAITKLPDHVLLEKEWMRSWVDVEGNKKVIYGRISAVEYDSLAGGKLSFTVELNEASRALVNAGFSVNGMVASKSIRDVEPPSAFGGCLAFNPNVVRPVDTPFFFSWHVPEMRHEAAVIDEQDTLTPQLTLQFRGYQLVLTAKKSTIPNAGKGVFCTCTSLLKGNDKFKLQPGELLDLGVYAPFRRRDHKKSDLFMLKNFIHGMICEEWSFNTPNDDDVFDITCDVTGELHDLAARHIPAYVNETDGDTTPSVFATHDPQGCVHYMLGHHESTNDAFTIRADGTEEKELFIDYGDQYEDPRVRKNYSRLPPDEAAQRRRYFEIEEYIEILDDLKSYSATEITESVDFMNQKVFLPDKNYKASTVVRALLVAVLFRKRVEGILDEFQHVVSVEDVCLGGYDTTMMKTTLQKIHTVIQRLFESCNNWAQFQKTILSKPIFLSCLEFILGDQDFHSMSAEEFGVQIMGHP